MISAFVLIPMMSLLGESLQLRDLCFLDAFLLCRSQG